MTKLLNNIFRKVFILWYVITLLIFLAEILALVSIIGVNGYSNACLNKGLFINCSLTFSDIFWQIIIPSISIGFIDILCVFFYLDRNNLYSFYMRIFGLRFLVYIIIILIRWISPIYFIFCLTFISIETFSIIGTSIVLFFRKVKYERDVHQPEKDNFMKLEEFH